MRKEIKSHWRTWIFLVTLGTVLIVIYKALDSIGYLGTFIANFLSVISPFLAGLLIAYLLYIPEHKIEKAYQKSRKKIIRKHARKWAILTTYIITILILIIIINFILPVLIESVNELIGNLQIYYTKTIETYNNLPEDSFFKSEKVYTALKEIQNYDFQKYLSVDRILGYVKSVVGVATGIFDIIVAIVASVYILAERNEIIKYFKKLLKAILKENQYKYIEKYFNNSNGVFFKFISSQFIDAIVVGVLATIALHILHVKYASLLGFTIGLFNMIPYFGAIFAIGIAALITLITGGFSKALILLIVIIILQQIDANIINPKIMGDSLKISPLLVVFAITVGGAYFGVIGMFLAVPVAAVLKILVNDYIDNKAGL